MMGQTITILPQQVSELLALTDGVNASSCNLPPPHLPGQDTLWERWVDTFSRAGGYLGCRVPGGEFIAYKLSLDGQPYTLVLFSWTQGGFDGAALVDGHPADMEGAAQMWLGETTLSEHDSFHPIHEILVTDTA